MGGDEDYSLSKIMIINIFENCVYMVLQEEKHLNKIIVNYTRIIDEKCFIVLSDSYCV